MKFLPFLLRQQETKHRSGTPKCPRNEDARGYHAAKHKNIKKDKSEK